MRRISVIFRVWLSAPHLPTCHILKEGEGVSTAEGGTPTCDSEQDEQHDRLHVTLPLYLIYLMTTLKCWRNVFLNYGFQCAQLKWGICDQGEKQLVFRW